MMTYFSSSLRKNANKSMVLKLPPLTTLFNGSLNEHPATETLHNFSNNPNSTGNPVIIRFSFKFKTAN